MANEFNYKFCQKRSSGLDCRPCQRSRHTYSHMYNITYARKTLPYFWRSQVTRTYISLYKRILKRNGNNTLQNCSQRDMCYFSKWQNITDKKLINMYRISIVSKRLYLLFTIYKNLKARKRYRFYATKYRTRWRVTLYLSKHLYFVCVLIPKSERENNGEPCSIPNFFG